MSFRSKIDLAEEQLYLALNAMYGHEKANACMQHVATIEDPDARMEFIQRLASDLGKALAGNAKLNYSAMTSYTSLVAEPVDPHTFLMDEYYLNKSKEALPEVAAAFVELNSGGYTEAVLTGGIGSGKTTIALWTTAYQLYLLSLFHNPQQFFSLESNSEIVFVFQTINKDKAEELDFGRFKALVDASPYFKEKFRRDRNVSAKLLFPKRIVVKAISGEEDGAIGENVFGGFMDEVNFMFTSETSKKAVPGETFSQAEANYAALVLRRKSRFTKDGQTAGIFCLVSSRNYPGQFTDIKEEERAKAIAETGSSDIYLYDKRVWEIKPKEYRDKEWFVIFKGDMGKKAKIITPNMSREKAEKAMAKTETPTQYMLIPAFYRSDFERNMIKALKDVAGVSTLASLPWFTDPEVVSRNMGKVQSILTREMADMVNTRPGYVPSNFKYQDRPRAVHIDLAKTRDAAGLTIGCVYGMKEMKVGNSVEIMPLIHIDCTLRIPAPKGSEINYQKIRELIYNLKKKGIKFKWASCDQYQSVDMLQQLKSNGMKVGTVSMDTTTKPYSTLKTAFADDRIDMPEDEHLQLELASLEYDPVKEKVDHPPTCTKDVADSLAGVVFVLTQQLENWRAFGINPNKIPEQVKNDAVNATDAMNRD